MKTKGLLRYQDDDYKPIRKSYLNEMELVNIGLGNYACVHESIYRDSLDCDIGDLVKLINENSNTDAKEMYKTVREYFNVIHK